MNILHESIRPSRHVQLIIEQLKKGRLLSAPPFIRKKEPPKRFFLLIHS